MKTRENKGRIEVQKGGGERDYLCKLFRVTPQMVWKALSFESDTDLAKKIRKAAMERGAQHVVELPIFETIHDNDMPVKVNILIPNLQRFVYSQSCTIK